MIKFETDDIVAISKVIAETMTGSEITTMFNSLGFKNFDVNRAYTSTKWVRIQESVINHININRTTHPLFATIEYASKPQKWVNIPDKWSDFKRSLNTILIFHEIELLDNGKVSTTIAPKTLDEATKRLNNLTEKLEILSVHQNVFKFAQKELLQDNFFHAILESSKGVMDRLRQISELNEDGNALIDKSFSVKHPIVLIKGNLLTNHSDRSAYLGLANLMRAIVSMYRNPKAHDPKLYKEDSLEDAIDAFILMSVVHRQLDNLVNIRDVKTEDFRKTD